MRKSKAIRLLKNQIEKIEDKNMQREEWLSSTASVILKVFPVSSKIKLEQLRNIENNPQYFEDITSQERIAVRKGKAKRYLLNYIEEIDLLGVESSGSKLQFLINSFRFWLLLTVLCSLSFLAGSSSSTTIFQQSHIPEFQEMKKQINEQEKKIDSLTQELWNRKILG